MDRTGWPRVYQGVQRGLLQSMASLPYHTTDTTDLFLGWDGAGGQIISPAADEGHLRHLMLAIDCVLDRCEETLQQTSRSILCWLLTTQPGPCFNRPFRLPARESSRQD
jgi:hypothetical protein